MEPRTPIPIARRAQLVHRLAGEEGFALVGIAEVRPSERAGYVVKWLSEGRHGQMEYLAEPGRLEQMLDARATMAGARSMICFAERYGNSPESRVQSPESGEHAPLGVSLDKDMQTTPLRSRLVQKKPAGRIARYAWGEDYHPRIKRRLKRIVEAMRAYWPEHEFRATADTGPVLEREHAQRAGLGWVGKNTLLIHPRLGSYMLLGQILTTLPIQASGLAGQPVMADSCGSCTRCLEACPTQCLTAYQLDASRCISYLTIEHKGVIEEGLEAAMGDWVAGCDVCQEVCPFNQLAGGSAELEAGLVGERGSGRGELRAIPLLEILGWVEADRRWAFTVSALKRIKLDQLKRNAVIAAGNVLAERPDPALRAKVAELAEDRVEDESVRVTASRVLARLTPCAARKNQA